MFTVTARLRLEDFTDTVAEFATCDEAMQFAKQHRDGPFYESAERRADSTVIAIYDWIDGFSGLGRRPFATIAHEQFRLPVDSQT